MVDYVQNCEIWPGFLSDHSFFYIEYGLKTSMRGPGTWKLNVSLLEDLSYINGVNIRLDRTNDKRLKGNPEKVWEYCKFDIADFSKEFAITKAKQQKKRNHGS